MSDPGPLLLEQRTETGRDLFVRRITQDGEIYVRTSFPRQDADGWEEEAGKPDWELRATIPQDALAALRAAIGETGFMDLDAEYRPDVAVIGSTDEIWTAELDGRAHSVALRGLPEVSVPAVTELGEAVERALGAAGV